MANDQELVQAAQALNRKTQNSHRIQASQVVDTLHNLFSIDEHTFTFSIINYHTYVMFYTLFIMVFLFDYLVVNYL